MQLQEWTMEEQEQLIHFLMTNTWPYHGNSSPARHLIEKTIEDGGYQSDEVKTFWVKNEHQEKIGVVKLYDLHDEIPMFDLRIGDSYRGNGYGSKALKMVVDFVFSLSKKKIRLQGHTRQDNLAMRKTFERVGFVKEAQLRKAWYSPKEDNYYDAVTYGITREDYLAGITTPVMWEDAGKKSAQVTVPTVLEELESERLLIRAPKIEDALEVWNTIQQSYDALNEWMRWAQKMPTLEETEENIREAIANFVTRKDLRLHVFLKETGEFIGSTGLHYINWEVPKFEIGYWLSSEKEGAGYMTEAVAGLSNYAFQELGARRIEIRCDEKNIKSRMVAERVGYELEGVLKQNSLSMDGKNLCNTAVYAKIR